MRSHSKFVEYQLGYARLRNDDPVADWEFDDIECEWTRGTWKIGVNDRVFILSRSGVVVRLFDMILHATVFARFQDGRS